MILRIDEDSTNHVISRNRDRGTIIDGAAEPRRRNPPDNERLHGNGNRNVEASLPPRNKGERHQAYARICNQSPEPAGRHRPQGDSEGGRDYDEINVCTSR